MQKRDIRRAITLTECECYHLCSAYQSRVWMKLSLIYLGSSELLLWICWSQRISSKADDWCYTIANQEAWKEALVALNYKFESSLALENS